MKDVFNNWRCIVAINEVAQLADGATFNLATGCNGDRQFVDVDGFDMSAVSTSPVRAL